MGALSSRCHRIAESRIFQVSILAVIVANAVVIGLETYPAVRERWDGALLEPNSSTGADDQAPIAW
jgi:hypothetical protein